MELLKLCAAKKKKNAKKEIKKITHQLHAISSTFNLILIPSFYIINVTIFSEFVLKLDKSLIMLLFAVYLHKLTIRFDGSHREETCFVICKQHSLISACINSHLASDTSCSLLISLDPDQDRQNVGPDLDPNHLTL